MHQNIEITKVYDSLLIHPTLAELHIIEGLRIIMLLQQQIDEKRKDVRTDSYAMSIGEWISMYQSGEVDIHPVYQRFFRWTPSQKSKFIESIILGIPIPPIFVSQLENGTWDVIDGVQRLSTIYEFVGILKDEKGEKRPPLILETVDYLPLLKGKSWDNSKDSENSLTLSQRLDIKRAKLHVNLILRESDTFAKYELFTRLNTGGSSLTEQEVRNCILARSNMKMLEFIRDLARYPSFRESVNLSDKDLSEQYDLDLVLRFLVFRQLKESELNKADDLQDLLRREMIAKAELLSDEEFAAERFAAERQAFEQTFDFLYDKLDGKENCFRRYHVEKEKFTGGFLLTPFEVLALGIGHDYTNICQQPSIYKDIIKRFWIDKYPDIEPKVKGTNAMARLKTTIPYGRKLFKV